MLLAVAAGFQLDKEAFDLLSSLQQTLDPVELMERAIKYAKDAPKGLLFIERGLLERVVKEYAQPSIIRESKRVFRAHARDVSPNVEVIEDPASKIRTTGSVDGYVKYFRNRFDKLQRILKQRIEVRDAVTVIEALRAPIGAKLKVLGMLTEKKETKRSILLKVEDLHADALVLVLRNAKELVEKAYALLLDQVVCISAIKGKNDLLIADDFIWPELPQRSPRTASEAVYVALTSDLHVGSRMFMREEFERFILWLNGEYGSPWMREVASRVKYLIIAGDIADGVGVYPKQMKELEVRDAYEQYEMASKFFERIPDYIEVIVVPGNHDACRKALPQPALLKDYAEPIYEARSILSLGNPCSIGLHGVEFLVYHGRSLDDVIASVPGLGFDSPEKAMRLLLRCRHLAPIYGRKTPIAPEPYDFLIVERVPDVFHAGHVHVMKHEVYRGTTIVNSGTWQRQTAYQREMGLIPTPGVIPIVNLQTLEVMPLYFQSP